MSSLCPGTLFSFPGFNKKSTPVPPQTTSEELSKRYRRQPFNGRPWPHGSPVSGVYDVGFSSTKMILYNNRKKRQSKLRGKNDPKNEETLCPDPNRHYRASSPVSRDLHSNCYNSQSPCFYQPMIIPWINYSERPPPTYEDGRFVNPKRHTSCCVPTDPLAFRVGVNNERRPHSRASLPPNFRSSPMLNHPDLRQGEKEYIGSIARIYSAQQMIKLKQKQYNQLLTLEMEKGYHTPEEYTQYKKFIELGRQRQYLRPSRAMSAPPDRWTRAIEESQSEEEEEESVKKSAPSKSPRSKSPSGSKGRRPVSVKSSRARPSTREASRFKSPAKSETSSKSATKPKAETKRSRSDSRSPPRPTKEKEEKGDSSDTSGSVQSSPDRKIHREGYDRPLSRLGHIPEDSKSQQSMDQESYSKPETKSKREETALEESDSTSKSDTVTKESSKSDNKSPTDDSYRTPAEDTMLSTDADKTDTDLRTDTETATDTEPQTESERKTNTAEPKPSESDSYTDDFEKDTSEKTDMVEQNKQGKAKASDSDSYTDDFERDTSENTEGMKKPPHSADKVVSFKKDSQSVSSDEDQSPNRRDSLSEDDEPSSKRDPDKLEY
ncbi:cylicin-2-like [Ostrea edulis]|uniref:cylicin-2-like n=1 Tax=Ostrea edulis TaxID=37623 RepID=UPI0024AEF41A|nr:cylicin-2-like [Ostrea edulis]